MLSISESIVEDIETTLTKVIDEYAANLNAFSKATGSSSLSSDATSLIDWT